MKILLTSTSFQDTPGSHHTLLDIQAFEIVKLRGPVKENELLPIIGDFDGMICGDDEITERVIEAGSRGRLKVLSKYGIGLDKIDLAAAKKYNIPVTNCPGVNQITVAEHVFALLMSFVKNIIPENEFIQNQQWVRLIGNDIFGKNMGIIGMGNVGKEVAKRATAFGLKIYAYDTNIDESFAVKHCISYTSLQKLFAVSDIISLNAPLTNYTRNLINIDTLGKLKSGVIIINTARAGLVQQAAVLKGIEDKIISGYLTDVLEEEPMTKDHPFLHNPRILITPHIGSRTYENVERQGTMAVVNLLKNLNQKND